jgi:hypothetical protein
MSNDDEMIMQMLLDSDYFSADATHIANHFQWRLMMNKELFMRIMFVVMTTTSCARKTAPGCGAFHQFRSARLLYGV